MRELLFGPLGFDEFTRGQPGVSRSVLAARLRYLARVGVVEKTGGPGGKYRLTAAGARLSDALQVLGEWATTWVMTDPTPAELDPELLGLFISRLIAHDQAPEQRVVVSFTLHDPSPGRSWLVLSRAESSICLEDPCLDPARYVYVDSDTETLQRVFMGRLPDDPEPERHVQWARGFWSALEPYADGPYVNFMHDEPPHRLETAYGAMKYQRLAALMRAYDHANVFPGNSGVLANGQRVPAPA